MANQSTLSINTPSLPKGGGAIQSIGKGLGPVGTLGTANTTIALPISSGRGYAPALSLGYSSHAGNGLCGMGWNLSQAAISRHARKGVPDYDEDDLFEGPDGEVWMPERTAQGLIARRDVRSFRGLDVGATWQVARYQPRIKSSFDTIEHWRSDADQPGFWLVQGADGSLHVYGMDPQARITGPQRDHVAQWLLQESMNAHGEHIAYTYKAEDGQGVSPQPPRDHASQRYLSRVDYGNATPSADLYAWGTSAAEPHWHFQLVLDYGERPSGLADRPGFAEQTPWSLRSDPFSSYAYGFELRTWRLLRQVLMFHHFPDETGPEPVRVKRLLLEYRNTAQSYTHLHAAHAQGYDRQGRTQYSPPMEFGYSEFDPADSRYQTFQPLPGLNDSRYYQLVDLYGEGLPGVLYRSDKCWYYREPQRAESALHADDVTYGQWQVLPRIPTIDLNAPVSQSLTDMTGDGRLDWVVSQAGMHGFFTMGEDRTWSNFTPFQAFPKEFFHPQAQLADLIGDGLSDLTLIGSQSVRLYRSTPKAPRFDNATLIDHDHQDDRLPTIGDSQHEVVAFSDLLGSGQQHLVRIRHDEIMCWPNLGHGTFGRGFRFAELPFAYDQFDASRVLLADLDGSGAADLLYLTPDHVQVFMNAGGNGLAQQPILQPWPEGVRWDRFCQVSTADLQGLGCSSLIITVPHGKPRHWRCDFVRNKPYLLVSTQNNMGASGQVSYRSSAQEWLDEKAELLAAGKPVQCHVPLAIHLVNRQQQVDEITGNQLTQRMHYRQGFYDGQDRELRGFGLLIQTDSEAPVVAQGEQDSAPLLTKTWFHTGRFIDMPGDDYDTSDTLAEPLGNALLLDPDHRIIEVPDPAIRHEMARAMSGLTLRVETYGLDGSDRQALPYAVQASRHGVVLERAKGNDHAYSVMRPQALESIHYAYERQPDDPQCTHTVQLEWDRFDLSTRTLSVSYARRKTAQDEPPFTEEHERTWWRDTHDEAQQRYHIDEALTEFIHLQDDQYLRLGLPYRARHNAYTMDAGDLRPADICFETLRGPDSPLLRATERALIGLSVQRYKRALPWDDVLPPGEATYQALTGYVENAELDEAALNVYNAVLSRAELEQRLIDDGYQRMSTFMPADNALLWATRSGFVTYSNDATFNQPIRIKGVENQGPTDLEYDAYRCQVVKVTSVDGCRTLATYDYRHMLPTRIIDANLNSEEALYDGFGALRASSFHGTEKAQDAGFAPIAMYNPRIISPQEAIDHPEAAVQGAAAVHLSDPFAWMGQAPLDLIKDSAWLDHHVSLGNVLPNGAIRQSARLRLTTDPESAPWVSQAAREPVYAVSLQPDRYPDDTEAAQIRIASTSWDGFGRLLQTRQKVEPGPAWQTSADGALVLRNGVPPSIDSGTRWRVSERVEYNHKGLAVRIYRPFFADHSRYVDDASLRTSGLSDRQLYDPAGRPTLTITAKDLWRRQRYLAWYSISEDENDTFEEAMADKARREGGSRHG